MSNLISSFIIDPVVRHARRFSAAAAPAQEGDSGRLPLSHANPGAVNTPPSTVPEAAHGHERATQPAGVQDSQHARALSHRLHIRRHSHFIRRPQSAALDEEDAGDHDGSVHDASVSLSARPAAPTAPIDIPADAGMSSNPSRTIESQLRQLDLDSALPATPATTTTVQSTTSASSGVPAHHAVAPAMSESLPADDGMHHLRERIHQIRDLKIADMDKARMMHGIMTERYNCLRPTSPSSFVSHDRPFTPTSGHSIFSDAHLSSPMSTASEVDPENPFNLRPGDTEPTYRTRPTHYNFDVAAEDEELDLVDDGPTFGCQHYKRNVKVQCYECKRWYTCRHCHDAVEDHNLNRRKTQNMLCMACGTAQTADEYCAECGTLTACYYCDICKLWDDNSTKKIYHCVDCGICRKGEGLGKDYVHCKVRHNGCNLPAMTDHPPEL